MNTHKIICVDYESDSPNPLTCSPTQLSAIAIDPRTLQIIPDSTFNSLIRPVDIDCEDYCEAHKSTLEFHGKVMAKSVEEVYQTWLAAPAQKTVWEDFLTYLNKYHNNRSKARTVFSAPIIAGYNILGFDLIIMQRLCEKYHNVDKQGRQTIFYNRDKIDVMNYVFLFFENSAEIDSYSLDSMRDYLGIPTEGGHDALKDVIDTAKILIEFQKLCRNIAKKTQFKNVFDPAKQEKDKENEES
jgi:DNA polymerase III epsilon subunit-like protein